MSATNTTTPAGGDGGSGSSDSKLWIVGVLISILATVGSNGGINLQKVSIMKELKKPRSMQRAYPLQPLWLLGFIGVVFGALGDFGSLAFAPQSLLIPLGGLTLLFNIWFARMCLGERTSRRDFIATLFILLGVVLITITGSKEGAQYTIEQIKGFLGEPPFIGYIICTIFTILVLYWYQRYCSKVKAQFGPWSKEYTRIHKSHVFTLPVLAGIFAAQTIWAAKCVVEMIKTTALGNNQFKYFGFYALLITTIALVLSQLHWLSKSLEVAPALIAVPVFQSILIVLSIVGGGVLFHELSGLNGVEIGIFLMGLIIMLFGMWLLSKRKLEGPQPPTKLFLYATIIRFIVRTRTNLRLQEAEKWPNRLHLYSCDCGCHAEELHGEKHALSLRPSLVPAVHLFSGAAATGSGTAHPHALLPPLANPAAIARAGQAAGGGGALATIHDEDEEEKEDDEDENSHQKRKSVHSSRGNSSDSSSLSASPTGKTGIVQPPGLKRLATSGSANSSSALLPKNAFATRGGSASDFVLSEDPSSSSASSSAVAIAAANSGGRVTSGADYAVEEYAVGDDDEDDDDDSKDYSLAKAKAAGGRRLPPPAPPRLPAIGSANSAVVVSASPTTSDASNPLASEASRKLDNKQLGGGSKAGLATEAQEGEGREAPAGGLGGRVSIIAAPPPGCPRCLCRLTPVCVLAARQSVLASRPLAETLVHALPFAGSVSAGLDSGVRRSISISSAASTIAGGLGVGQQLPISTTSSDSVLSPPSSTRYLLAGSSSSHLSFGPSIGRGEDWERALSGGVSGGAPAAGSRLSTAASSMVVVAHELQLEEATQHQQPSAASPPGPPARAGRGSRAITQEEINVVMAAVSVKTKGAISARPSFSVPAGGPGAPASFNAGGFGGSISSSTSFSANGSAAGSGSFGGAGAGGAGGGGAGRSRASTAGGLTGSTLAAPTSSSVAANVASAINSLIPIPSLSFYDANNPTVPSFMAAGASSYGSNLHSEGGQSVAGRNRGQSLYLPSSSVSALSASGAGIGVASSAGGPPSASSSSSAPPALEGQPPASAHYRQRSTSSTGAGPAAASPAAGSEDLQTDLNYQSSIGSARSGISSSSSAAMRQSAAPYPLPPTADASSMKVRASSYSTGFHFDLNTNSPGAGVGAETAAPSNAIPLPAPVLPLPRRRATTLGAGGGASGVSSRQRRGTKKPSKARAVAAAGTRQRSAGGVEGNGYEEDEGGEADDDDDNDSFDSYYSSGDDDPVIQAISVFGDQIADVGRKARSSFLTGFSKVKSKLTSGGAGGSKTAQASSGNAPFSAPIDNNKRSKSGGSGEPGSSPAASDGAPAAAQVSVDEAQVARGFIAGGPGLAAAGKLRLPSTPVGNGAANQASNAEGFEPGKGASLDVSVSSIGSPDEGDDGGERRGRAEGSRGAHGRTDLTPTSHSPSPSAGSGDARDGSSAVGVRRGSGGGRRGEDSESGAESAVSSSSSRAGGRVSAVPRRPADDRHYSGSETDGGATVTSDGGGDRRRQSRAIGPEAEAISGGFDYLAAADRASKPTAASGPGFGDTQPGNRRLSSAASQHRYHQHQQSRYRRRGTLQSYNERASVPIPNSMVVTAGIEGLTSVGIAAIKNLFQKKPVAAAAAAPHSPSVGDEAADLASSSSPPFIAVSMGAGSDAGQEVPSSPPLRAAGATPKASPQLGPSLSSSPGGKPMPSPPAASFVASGRSREPSISAAEGGASSPSSAAGAPS